MAIFINYFSWGCLVFLSSSAVFCDLWCFSTFKQTADPGSSY